MLGGDLVDGDTEVDVGAGGLACLAAGEERGVGPCVVAWAVAVGFSFVEIEPAEDLEFIAQGSERF